MNTVGLTVITREDMVADNPDLVSRFVAGIRESYEYASENTEEAIEAAMRAKADLDADTLRGQLLVDLQLLESEASKGKGIGYGAPEDWQRTLDLMIQYRDLETDREATSFYTNDFLPAE